MSSPSPSPSPDVGIVDSEFEYGSPEIEADRSARVRVPAIPKPHPHDTQVFGSRPGAPTPALTQPAPALTGLIDRAVSDPKFKSLLFATPPPPPVVSPPPSARGSARGEKAKTPVKPPAASKKPKPGDVPPPTAEELLIQGASQDLMLYLRESTEARQDFEDWKKDTNVVALPIAPAPLSQVDTRLYTHLLNSVPQGSVNVHTMLHAMFEQVGVHSGLVAGASKPVAPVDLDAFFAGEQLSDVEAFMSSALERVTFNSHAATTWKQDAPAKDAAGSGVGLGVVPAEPAPYISYGDNLAQRRAEAALALGLPLVPDSISLAAETLLQSFLPVPGVGGRGMPHPSGEEQSRQAMDATQLLARATSGEQALSQEVFERALLLLELEEMLLDPQPDFKYTLHAALDPSGERQEDVLIHPLPSKLARDGSLVPLPGKRCNQVKERKEGASLYHTSHARQANRTIEQAILAKLREMDREARENGDKNGLGHGIGLIDTTVNQQQDWSLEQRSTMEELDQRVLPQRLFEAIFRPSGLSQTSVRYRPLFDELLVTVTVPTPLKRQDESLWSGYFTPDLSLDRWFQASNSIQRSKPTVLYKYQRESESGKLAIARKNFYPPNRSILSTEIVQQGESLSARITVEIDGTVMVLERVVAEVLPSVVKQQPKVEEIVVPSEDENAAEQATSRPGSREGTARGGKGTTSNSARKGSAGSSSTKKGAASPAADPKSKDAAKAKPAAAAAGKAPASTSAKKKAQLEEQAHLDELAQAFKDAQVELDLAKATEGAAKEEAASVDASGSAVVFAARFDDSTRIAASGRLDQGTSRVTYTTRTGLVVELRAQNQVYLSYPRSVLAGGRAHPIVSAGPAKDGETIDVGAPAGVNQPGLSLDSYTEAFRVVSPEGIVYRVTHSGAQSLLLPNGEVAQRENGQSEWIWTGLEGERSQVGSNDSFEPVHVAKQYDAESGATVWTRQDLTMFLSYKDGSSLVQHADGTRVYTDVLSTDQTASSITHGNVSDSKPRCRVRVEAPLFPPMVFTHSLRTDLRQSAEAVAAAGLDGASSSQIDGPLTSGIQRRNVVDISIAFDTESASIEKSAKFDSSVLFTRRGGEHILVSAIGRVFYISRSLTFSDVNALPQGFLQGSINFDSIPQHVFDFDLNLDGENGGGSLRLKDDEDSLYALSCVGTGSMILGRERNLAGGEQDSIPASYYPLPANPIPPRTFVVRSDGSGYELLDQVDVAFFNRSVSSDKRVRILPAESLGLGQAESKKFLLTLPPAKPYQRRPTIPNVVRAAPSGLAAGSSLALLEARDPLVVLKGDKAPSSPVIAPPVLVYRHLVSVTPVSLAQKAQAQAARQAWLDFKEQSERSAMLYVLDAAKQIDRDADEVAEEQRVEAEVRRAREALQARKFAMAEYIAESDSKVGGHDGVPRSRPQTANNHRTAASAAMLPKPAHEQDEGEQVVQSMLATLTAPPKSFFKPKGAAPAAKEKQPRPPSASSSSLARASLDALSNGGSSSNGDFGSFFSHPSFRREFLLSGLLQRATDLCSPFIQGSGRAAEQGEQTAQEKEDLWASLSEQQKEIYSAQFQSQLNHLLDNFDDFLKHASAFLKKPYSVANRSINLQSSPYVELLDQNKCSSAFPELVETLAGVIGYQRENELLVLVTTDDQLFKENLQLVKERLSELRQTAAASSNNQSNGPAGRKTPSGIRNQQEEKEPSVNPNATSASEARSGSELDGTEGGDGVDYESVVAALSAKERKEFMSTPAYQQYLAREQRLKSIKSTYSTQHHASHGASFQYVSPFAPKDPHYPPAPARTSLSQNPVPTRVDVTGAERKTKNQVQLPAAMGATAHAELNQKYLLNELQSGQPRPAAKTSSTVKQTWHTSTAPFAAFVLQPASLELGILRKGCTYRATLALTNTGNMTGRFVVVQPERADLVHVKVLYRPGLVAPGLQRRLEVELYAGSPGELQEEIVIKTEQHIFRLPITAHVLNDAEFARVKDGGVGASNPLLQTSFTAPAVHAPAMNASYEKNFPTSPLARTKAGPFQLTSTFNQPTTAGPQFSKNASALSSASVPRSNFGDTGEIRLVSTAATPHVAHAVQKQASRLSGASAGRSGLLQTQAQSNRQEHEDDASEI